MTEDQPPVPIIGTREQYSRLRRVAVADGQNVAGFVRDLVIDSIDGRRVKRATAKRAVAVTATRSRV
jgi:hypothetical protein